MVKVFKQTDGKLLALMNYQPQKILVFNSVQMGIFKIHFMAQIPMMPPNLLLLDNWFTTNNQVKKIIYYWV